MNSQVEMFPLSEVEVESPRLIWTRKHGVRTRHFSHLDPGEGPWAAWFEKDEDKELRIPDNPDVCGFADTELEAIQCLAVESGTPLWDEVLPASVPVNA